MLKDSNLQGRDLKVMFWAVISRQELSAHLVLNAATLMDDSVRRRDK